MSVYVQLFWVSALSGLAALLTFLVLSLRKKNLPLPFMFLIFGVMAHLFWGHLSGMSLSASSSFGVVGGQKFLSDELLWFVVGIFGTAIVLKIKPFARIFRRHKHNHHCESDVICVEERANNFKVTLLWMFGLVPHSAADGVLWGLSLGFSPAFAREVFLFLVIHRSVEMASWVGLLYGRFSARIQALSAVVLSMLSFWLGAVFSLKLGFSGLPYRKTVVCFLFLTLGYLIFLGIEELISLIRFHRREKTLRQRLILPGLSFVLGFLISSGLLKILRLYFQGHIYGF
jgi:zinc transporter ZupT